MKLEFTVGADPELFVRQNDKFISAHTFIPGTKFEPYPVEGGAIQKDGVSAEYNIFPARDADEFVALHHIVQDEMKKFLPSDAELVPTPTAWFDQEYFDELPPEPKMLGCTPDFNAYTGRANKSPATHEPFRTGSGHVHLGWGDGFDPYDDRHVALCREVVKQLDVALYYPSLAWDSDNQRRKLYGKIGAFRPRSYGVEYRPLSNAYLRDDNLVKFVYDRTVWAADLFFNREVKLYDNAPTMPEKYL